MSDATSQKPLPPAVQALSPEDQKKWREVLVALDPPRMVDLHVDIEAPNGFSVVTLHDGHPVAETHLDGTPVRMIRVVQVPSPLGEVRYTFDIKPDGPGSFKLYSMRMFIEDIGFSINPA